MLRRILCSLVAALILCTAASAASSISEATADCTVAEDGACTVTTTVVLQLEESLTEISLPVAQDAKDAACRGYDAKVRKEDGFVWLDVPLTAPITGQQTFTITYTVPGTVTVADDGTQQFSAELLSSQWAYPVEKFQYLVSMPKDITETPVLLSGYYGEIAPNQVVTNQNARSAAAVLTVPLLDHESISLQLKLPENYFPQPGPILGSGFPWHFVPPILLLLSLLYWFLTLRSPLPRWTAIPQPPDGVTAGELPVLLYGGAPDFSLTVAHWGALGYLAIAPHSRGKMVLLRRMDMGNERRSQEQQSFDRLFSAASACYCDDRAAQSARQMGEKLALRHWQRRLFDPKSGSPRLLCLPVYLAAAVAGGRILTAYLGEVLSPLLWAILGAVLGIVCAVFAMQTALSLLRGTQGQRLIGALTALVLLVAGGFAGQGPDTFLVLVHLTLTAFAIAFGGRRTALGTELLQKTLGYKRYLAGLDETALRRLVRQNPQFYYETLPYAEALGLGQKLTDRLQGVKLEPCAYLPGTTSASAFYQRFETFRTQLDGQPASPAPAGKTRAARTPAAAGKR